MGIPQRHLVTREMLKKHKKRIEVCRGIVCMEEIGIVFGTKESNELERIIDNKEPRRNEHGEAQWSRKYDRYLTGTVPNPATVENISKKAKELDKTENVAYWRDLSLWTLLKEPFASLEKIREVMNLMPHNARKNLFHLREIESCVPPLPQDLVDHIKATAPPDVRELLIQLERLEKPEKRLLRQDFSRKQAIKFRDMRSLDGFIALLAIAREGEILEEDPRQALSARCAFEIFPLILLDNPHLHACREELFLALKLAFWDRELHGGFYYSEYTFENVEIGLETYARDRSAKLPWTAGIIGPPIDYKKLFPHQDMDEDQDD